LFFSFLFFAAMADRTESSMSPLSVSSEVQLQMMLWALTVFGVNLEDYVLIFLLLEFISGKHWLAALKKPHPKKLYKTGPEPPDIWQQKRTNIIVKAVW